VTASEIALSFCREAIGGGLLGALTGWMALRMLKGQRDPHIDLLTSLALATGTFSIANQLGMSGAIAVVAAGLCFGTSYSHSIFDEASRKDLDVAWTLIDEVLNILLFMLIGFEILEIKLHVFAVLATLAIIPLSIAVRAMSVLFSILPAHLRQWERGRVLGILTWGGLRGGISVSLALGLPAGDLLASVLRRGGIHDYRTRTHDGMGRPETVPHHPTLKLRSVTSPQRHLPVSQAWGLVVRRVCPSFPEICRPRRYREVEGRQSGRYQMLGKLWPEVQGSLADYRRFP